MIDFNQLETLPLSEQVERLQAEFDAVSAQSPIDTDYFNRVSNRLNEKKAVLETEQAQQERAQKKQETIDNYVDIMSEMFEAIFPSDKYRQLLRINEYEDKRAQYYQLNHTYVAELIESSDKQHELELAQKDERIRLLNEQSLKVQQQLDEVNHELNEYKEHNQTLSDDIAERNGKIAEYSVKLENANSEIKVRDGIIETFKQQISDLEIKLEAAQKPRETKPSQKLSDAINEIKARNTMTANDWLERFNARQKDDEVKLQIPEITPPVITESPFRAEADNTTQPSGDQLLDSTPTVGQVGSQFPEVPTTSTVDTGSSNVDRSSEPVTRAEFTAEIAQLKKELAEIRGEKVA